MVSPRTYRNGLPPDKDLRKLFLDRCNYIDTGLSSTIHHGLCVHPPGTIVMLQSGETAVCVRHDQQTQPNCFLFHVLDNANSRTLTGKEMCFQAPAIEKIYAPIADNNNYALYAAWKRQSLENRAVKANAVTAIDAELHQAMASIKGVKIPPLPEVVVAIQKEINKTVPDMKVIADLTSTAAQKFCSKYWQFNRST